MAVITILNKSLNATSKKLGSIPSFAFALIYLFSIPFFALLFWIIPNGFYHSTVQYETSLDKDADILLKQLQKEIISTFKGIHGSKIAEQDGWAIDITTTHFHSLEPIKNAIKFRFRAKFWGVGEQNEGMQQSMNVNVKLPDGPVFNTFDSKTNLWTILKFPEIENQSQLPTNPNLIFPYKHNYQSQDYKQQSFQMLFPITTTLQNQINAFWSTSKGFPAQSTGSYVRMLYFSAVTITTLGYGDIVPISNAARLLVALESILGIIFIGLFLNSLARESSSKQT